MEGWIKLHRITMENKVFQNALLFKTFMWCLMSANTCQKEWKPSRSYKSITIGAGEFVTSRRNAAIALSCSESAVTRRLKQLEEDGCIIINANSRYTKITVVNWALYQGDTEKANSKRDHIQDSKRTDRRTADERTGEHDLRINKNNKNKKEEEMLSPFGGGSMG